jgi:hypothetical protein
VVITWFSSSSSSRLTTLSARASYQKQTNSTPPRDLSAEALAHSRGRLPQPEHAFNVVPHLPSTRAATAVASSHIAASKAEEAGPSKSNSRQALSLRSGSPIRTIKEPIVRPPSHIRPRPRPRMYAHDSGDYNPHAKLSKKGRVAQARCATPLSVPDSDPESVSSNEDEDNEDNEDNEGEGDDDEGVTQSEPEAVPRTPPRRQLSRRRTPPPPDGSPLKVATTPISRPGDFAPLIQSCTPIWTAADDEKLRTEFDPDSPTRLLAKLEQSWMTRVPSAQSALPAYAYTTRHFQGLPLYLGHKRSREEEDKDEERRSIIWNPWKRAKTDTKSPFDPAPGDGGLKLSDFASGVTPALCHAYPTNLLLPPPNFIQPTVLPAPHQSPAIADPLRNGQPGPSNT